MDVGDPASVVESVADKALASAAPRDEGRKGRSNLGDGAPVEPVILPELAGVAIADGPGRGSTEEHRGLVIGREVEMLPGAVRVGSLQP